MPSAERELSHLPPPSTERQTQQFLDEALQQPLGGQPSVLVQGKRNKEGIKVRRKTDEKKSVREKVRIKGKVEVIRGRDGGERRGSTGEKREKN